MFFDVIADCASYIIAHTVIVLPALNIVHVKVQFVVSSVNCSAIVKCGTVLWSFRPDLEIWKSAMPLDEAGSIQGHTDILLIELDLTKEQLNLKELKPPEARSLLTQTERIRSEYMPLAGRLQGLGAPASNQDCFTTMKRIFTTRSQLMASCPAASFGASSSLGGASAPIQAKFPQIQLPVFSGDTEEWLAWSCAFCSTVDSHDDLASDAKLQYLITSVSVETLRLISESEATGASYATVMRELRTRYEHRSMILKHLLDSAESSGQEKIQCHRFYERPYT